ncbi:MAG: hypothetical protein MPJ24_08350 [Pirellulaceae bacterium]|nr:hypothetical protein [Pirellulaceae bacterium]
MWRAFFLAVGIICCILGGECLTVKKATLVPYEVETLQTDGLGNEELIVSTETKDFTPPEWAPWSLLSTGVVIILYSFTIPRLAGGV